MFKNLFSFFAKTSTTPEDPANAALRKKQTGIWVAGIFTLLGLVFFLYDVYTVFIDQKGRFDLSDKVLMPVSAVMLLVAIASLFLIRRNRLSLGAGLLFYYFVLVPPVVAVLLLQGIVTIAVVYIILLASVLIGGVLPTVSWRREIVAAAIAAILCIAIEYWNPGFRTGTGLGNFAVIVTVIAAIVILGILIRQAILGNIRTKLVISFVLIAVISVSIVVFFVDQSSRTSFTNTIGNNLNGLANGEGIQVAQTLDGELDKLNSLALSKAVQDRAEAGTAADHLSAAEINTLDLEWRAADAANNNSDPLVSKVMNDSLSAELLKYQAKFPENVEVFLTDLPGVSIATTDRTSDYLQSDEDWWQAAYKDGEYIGQPEFDASSKTLAINMAVVVRSNDSNQIVGVLRTTVNINSLANVLQAGLVGKTGQTNVYLPDGQVIKLVPGKTGTPELTVAKTDLNVKTLSKSTAKYLSTTVDNSPSLLSLSAVSVSENDPEANLIKNLGWYVVTHQDQTEALLPVTQQTQNNFILAVIIAVLAALAAFGLAQVLAGPIVRLNAAAEKVAAGDLTIQAKVETNDETGTLATTFNKMVAQLGNLVSTLEQRVTDRTKALATSADVSRRLSTIMDQPHLVSEVVEQVRSAFGYYHAHIYLVDEDSGDLVMAGGTGEAGQTMLANGHRIQHGRGLVGRAAETKDVVLVPDTTKDPAWLPNPLLPETKSEIAVPIQVGNQVLGVLDVQNNVPDSLSEQDADMLSAIANQTAIAIQNIRQYEQTQHTSAQLSEALDIAKLANWEYDVEKDLFTFNDHFYSIFHTTAEDDGRLPIVLGPVRRAPGSSRRCTGGRRSDRKSPGFHRPALQHPTGTSRQVFRWWGRVHLCDCAYRPR